MQKDIKNLLESTDKIISLFEKSISKQNLIVSKMRRNREYRYDYDTLIYLIGGYEYERTIIASCLDDFNGEEKELFADYVSILTDILDICKDTVKRIIITMHTYNDILVLEIPRILYSNNAKIINLLKKSIDVLEEYTKGE